MIIDLKRSINLRWLFDPVLLFILRWSCYQEYKSKWSRMWKSFAWKNPDPSVSAKAYFNICTVYRYVGERQLTWISTPQKTFLLLKSSSESVSQLFARKASGLHTAGEKYWSYFKMDQYFPILWGETFGSWLNVFPKNIMFDWRIEEKQREDQL